MFIILLKSITIFGERIIYFPLFARFENDELLKYIEDDIKEIINNKKNKGLI